MDLFWGDITPKLFKKYTKAYKRRQRDIDELNHVLGNYIAIGINNPKEYPKKPYLSEENETKKDMTDSSMELEARRIAKMFGGEIK